VVASLGETPGLDSQSKRGLEDVIDLLEGNDPPDRSPQMELLQVGELRASSPQRYQDMFGVGFEFLLYDVTSTCFEGQALAACRT
jgi:hypothetical protein